MYEQASQIANDAVGSIRTIASFSAEEKVVELYTKASDIKGKTKKGMISGISYGVTTTFLFLVYAASGYVGARLMEDGKITFTDYFRVSFNLLRIFIYDASFFSQSMIEKGN